MTNGVLHSVICFKTFCELAKNNLILICEIPNVLLINAINHDLQGIHILVNDLISRWRNRVERVVGRLKLNAPIEALLQLVETHLDLIVNAINGNLLDLEKMLKI